MFIRPYQFNILFYRTLKIYMKMIPYLNVNVNS